MTQGKKIRTVIATSIAPFDMERQANAVASWLNAGFEVVSLNTEGEIEKVKARFPKIKFVPVFRDARALTGKPLVFLDDIFEYLSKSGVDVCGIVNSDVWLGAGDDFIPFLDKEVGDGLVFGSRIDVDDLSFLHGRIYPAGFDYFFFRPAFAKNYPSSEFGIGIPWWDYWAPMLPLMKGIEVKQLLPPIGYHVNHPIKWSDELHADFSRRFSELLRREKLPLELNAEVVANYGEKAALYLAAVRYIHDGSKAITYEPRVPVAVAGKGGVTRHLDISGGETEKYWRMEAMVYEKYLDVCMERAPALLSTYITVGGLIERQLKQANSRAETWKKESKRLAGENAELWAQIENLNKMKNDISGWLVERNIQASKLNHRISEKTLQIAELERRMEEKEKQKAELERRLLGI